MKPIRIIDRHFKLLGEIDSYSSLQFNRRWHTYGDFELHVNRYVQGAEHLQKGNIIILGNQPHKAAIIRHMEIEVGEGGKASENWAIRGQTLESLTGCRMVIPPFHYATGPVSDSSAFDSFKGSAEDVMKHYIEAHITSPADTKRKINEIRLAQSLSRGPQLTWQAEYEKLSEVLEKISNETGLGIEAKLDFDLQKIIVDTREGVNRSAFQEENDPVIFSIMYDNIKSQRYTDSDMDVRTAAYALGSGDGVDKKIVELGEAEGWNRIETAFDLNIDIDQYDYEETGLTEQGKQKLNEYKEIKTLEGQVMNTGPFLYEEDWQLGDIVTVQNKDWGVTMNSRITEVKEIYEGSDFDLEVTFGNKVPDIIDKLKRAKEGR